MRVGEAKDFLVQQTADQAQREGIALSDLEKRMMYFTEGPDATENPITLNEEFEAQYDTAEYEIKIARLMGHAYRQLKKESPDAARTWDAAIRELRKGDHYILVMWSPLSSATAARWGFWKTMGASLILVVLLLTLITIFGHGSSDYNFRGNWKAVNGTHSPSPAWVQRSALALLVGVYIYSLYYCLISKRSKNGIASSIAKLWRSKSNDTRER
jgi:hypothetical protein